jgi:tetratricopeptide (TPR) repeat protein
MANILKRSAGSVASRPLLFLFFLPVLALLGGCSAPSLPSVGEDRREAEVNGIIEEANNAIAEHDRRFMEARETYEEALRSIERGGDAEKEAERIAQARETLGEARASLQEARDALGRIERLDVDPEVKRYARLLSEATRIRSEAEAREMEYYKVLEGDPILRDDREEALRALDEAREGYRRADRAFDRVERFAADNPDLFRSRG